MSQIAGLAEAAAAASPRCAAPPAAPRLPGPLNPAQLPGISPAQLPGLSHGLSLGLPEPSPQQQQELLAGLLAQLVGAAEGMQPWLAGPDVGVGPSAGAPPPPPASPGSNVLQELLSAIGARALDEVEAGPGQEQQAPPLQPQLQAAQHWLQAAAPPAVPPGPQQPAPVEPRQGHGEAAPSSQAAGAGTPPPQPAAPGPQQ